MPYIQPYPLDKRYTASPAGQIAPVATDYESALTQAVADSAQHDNAPVAIARVFEVHRYLANGKFGVTLGTPMYVWGVESHIMADTFTDLEGGRVLANEYAAQNPGVAEDYYVLQLFQLVSAP